MTYRLPISVERIRWRDGQQTRQEDLVTEQNSVVQTDAAIMNNFFGSGVLPATPDRAYLFDSDHLTIDQSALVAGYNFDGYGIAPHGQPLDSSLGAQLEIELTGSSAFGRHNVKVLVLGLDFQGVLQYEKFVFHKNELQVGKLHFARILSLMFNDFKGNHNFSRNL